MRIDDCWYGWWLGVEEAGGRMLAGREELGEYADIGGVCDEMGCCVCVGVRGPMPRVYEVPFTLDAVGVEGEIVVGDMGGVGNTTPLLLLVVLVPFGGWRTGERKPLGVVGDNGEKAWFRIGELVLGPVSCLCRSGLAVTDLTTVRRIMET